MEVRNEAGIKAPEESIHAQKSAKPAAEETAELFKNAADKNNEAADGFIKNETAAETEKETKPETSKSYVSAKKDDRASRTALKGGKNMPAVSARAEDRASKAEIKEADKAAAEKVTEHASKESAEYTASLSQDEREFAVRAMEYAVKTNEKERRDAQDEGGIFAGIWDSVKNFFGMEYSPDEIQKRTDVLKSKIEDVKNGKLKLEDVYKEVTGNELTAGEIKRLEQMEQNPDADKDDGIVRPKAKLTFKNSKIERDTAEYKAGRDAASDIAADTAAITAGIGAAAMTGGLASPFLIAGASFAGYLGVKEIEGYSKNKEYTAEEKLKDTANAAISGVLNAAGMKVSKGLAAAGRTKAAAIAAGEIIGTGSAVMHQAADQLFNNGELDYAELGRTAAVTGISVLGAAYAAGKLSEVIRPALTKSGSMMPDILGRLGASAVSGAAGGGAASVIHGSSGYIYEKLAKGEKINWAELKDASLANLDRGMLFGGAAGVLYESIQTACGLAAPKDAESYRDIKTKDGLKARIWLDKDGNPSAADIKTSDLSKKSGSIPDIFRAGAGKDIQEYIQNKPFDARTLRITFKTAQAHRGGADIKLTAGAPELYSWADRPIQGQPFAIAAEITPQQNTGGAAENSMAGNELRIIPDNMQTAPIARVNMPVLPAGGAANQNTGSFNLFQALQQYQAKLISERLNGAEIKSLPAEAADKSETVSIKSQQNASDAGSELTSSEYSRLKQYILEQTKYQMKLHGIIDPAALKAAEQQISAVSPQALLAMAGNAMQGVNDEPLTIRDLFNMGCRTHECYEKIKSLPEDSAVRKTKFNVNFYNSGAALKLLSDEEILGQEELLKFASQVLSRANMPEQAQKAEKIIDFLLKGKKMPDTKELAGYIIYGESSSIPETAEKSLDLIIKKNNLNPKNILELMAPSFDLGSSISIPRLKKILEEEGLQYIFENVPIKLEAYSSIGLSSLSAGLWSHKENPLPINGLCSLSDEEISMLGRVLKNKNVQQLVSSGIISGNGLLKFASIDDAALENLDAAIERTDAFLKKYAEKNPYAYDIYMPGFISREYPLIASMLLKTDEDKLMQLIKSSGYSAADFDVIAKLPQEILSRTKIWETMQHKFNPGSIINGLSDIAEIKDSALQAEFLDAAEENIDILAIYSHIKDIKPDISTALKTAEKIKQGFPIYSADMLARYYKYRNADLSTLSAQEKLDLNMSIMRLKEMLEPKAPAVPGIGASSLFNMPLSKSVSSAVKNTLENIAQTQPMRTSNPVKSASFSQLKALVKRKMQGSADLKAFTDEEIEEINSFAKTVSKSLKRTITPSSVSADDIKTMMTGFFANNGSQPEKLIAGTDFSQFGKQGVPLSYSRQTFLSDLTDLLGSLPESLQEDILRRLEIIPVRGENGALTGYNGIINLEKLSSEGIEGSIKGAAKKFIYENSADTGNSELDSLINSLIQGMPEFVNIIGKQQHDTHELSLDSHILKVLQEALSSPEYQSLSNIDKTCLKFTAVMHDIAKKEGIIDEEHPYASALYAGNILEKYPFPQSIKDRIYGLIKNHHWLKEYSQNGNSDKIAADFRHKDDFAISRILAEADLKGVSESFYLQHKDALDAERLAPISQAYERMNELGQLVFTSRLIRNDLIPEIEYMGHKYRVLNFKDMPEDADLSQYGFAPGTTKKSARFYVHMARTPEDLETVSVLSDAANGGFLCASYISPSQADTYWGLQFGAGLECGNENIANAAPVNQGSGGHKNYERFVKIKTGSDETSMHRSTIPGYIKNALNLTDAEYSELYQMTASKEHITQIRDDAVFEIGNKKFSGKEIKDAVCAAEDSLISGAQNESNLYVPKIKWFPAKADSLEEIPEAFLAFARKYNLPVFLLGAPDKKQPEF